MKILLIQPKTSERPRSRPAALVSYLIKFEGVPVYLFAAVSALLVYQALNLNIETALVPYVFAINILYQTQFEFISGLGYQEVRGLFIIGRDCLGGRLFICLFSVLTVCRLNIYRHLSQKIFAIFRFCIFSILGAYITTVIRIAASVPLIGTPNFKLTHTLLSLIIYFGSGLALYAFLERHR